MLGREKRFSVCGSVLVACLLAFSTMYARGSDHALGLRLRSERIEGFDRDPRIHGWLGPEVEFTADITLSTANSSVQGWSFGLWHSGVDLVDITIEGTAAERESRGGLRPIDSFIRYEIVDPAKNGGRQGVVQTALSFVQTSFLPARQVYVLGRHRYSARVEEEGRTAFLRFEDRLVGSGVPLPINVVDSGGTVIPSTRNRDIRIGSDVIAERGRCIDGVDNDNDGWVDCLDPDCFSLASCGRETCDDGRDNDDDGLVDCDDSDCSEVCHEICGDGVDNDGDSAIDCEDSTCLRFAPCARREYCDDGEDNDGNGFVDCDDHACYWRPPCRLAENCVDGIDNDGDGAVDCDDKACSCYQREVLCEDGIDNDRDGLTDCDDDDCELRSKCLKEDCFDGVDNDLDGRADCDDSNCDFFRFCDDVERCDDGLDNDGDGRVDCDDSDCSRRRLCTGAPEKYDGALSSSGDAGEPGLDLVLYSPGAFRERRVVTGKEGVDVESDVNVLEVAFDQAGKVDVAVYIVPTGISEGEGAQGWSISVEHEQETMSLQRLWFEGTDASAIKEGGFEKTERVWNPLEVLWGGGARRSGFVSSIVLSFPGYTTPPVDRPSTIAHAVYRLKEDFGPAGEANATIRFADGLLGSGQPVTNRLTVQSSTVIPNFVPLEIRRVASPPFLRGDANDDGRVDLGDAIWSLNFLYRNGPETACREAADVNADSKEDMSDAIYLIQYQYLDGPPIPSPFPDCGKEPARLCQPGSVSACN